MSETIETTKRDELTADQLDLAVGGEQISFNFTRPEYKYTPQKADGS